MKITLTIINICLSIGISVGQNLCRDSVSWLNPAIQGNHLNQVRFIDNNTAISVSDYGTVLRTIDAGQTWNIISSGINTRLNDIFFSSPSEGYISGDSGIMLKTTDGGLSWAILNTNTKESLSTIFFKNSNEGFVYASNGKILKTIDAGNNWSYINSNSTISGISFLTDKVWYSLYGFTLFKTSDSGLTWDSIGYINTNISRITRILFLNEKVGFVGTYYSSMGYAGGSLYKTLDGGKTWSSADPNIGAEITDIYFADSLQGYVVGVSGYYFLNNTGEIYKTIDGGKNWTSSVYGIIPVSKIHSSPSAVVAVGNYGNISRTTDGGQSWKSSLAFVDKVTDISFISPTIGYASWGNYCSIRCSPFGAIVKTIDGGISWKQVLNGRYFNTVQFLDSLSGFAADDRTIYRTTNGGVSWQGFSAYGIANLYFVDVNNGYAVSNDFATIYKTSNAGQTWTTLKTYNNVGFITVYFKDVQNGFISCEYGNNTFLLRTKNGGSDWDTIPVSSRILKIHFADSKTGYASSEKGTIFKTTDGGSTWNTIKLNIDDTFTSIHFFNSDTGYVAGSSWNNNKSSILKTMDGGNSWLQIHNSAHRSLNAMSFGNRSLGYLAGDHGCVLKLNTCSSEGSVDSVYLNTITQVTNLKLESNRKMLIYPNPSQGIFTIQLLETADYLVAMYNSQGEEVYSSSFAEVQTKIKLENIPPGIYYITISSNIDRITQKLIFE
jgi:photosystem II stability/assembly factor-like uncharacterized protein